VEAHLSIRQPEILIILDTLKNIQNFFAIIFNLPSEDAGITKQSPGSRPKLSGSSEIFSRGFQISFRRISGQQKVVAFFVSRQCVEPLNFQSNQRNYSPLPQIFS